MARIEGVDIPRNKRIEIGLRSIYGVGPTRANEILAATGVNRCTLSCRIATFPNCDYIGRIWR